MTALLTRKEAAARLGVTVQTIDALRTSGKLAYLQRAPNAKVFFSEASIEEYLARITHRAKPEMIGDTYRKRRK